MKIGVDMDGVLADFTNGAIRTVQDKWDIKMTYEEMIEPRMSEYVWDRLPDTEKAMYKDTREIYKYIAPPGFFETLDPYEGVIDSLKVLSKIHDVVIITKPLEYDYCPGEKHRWLKKHLGYTPNIILVNSMQCKGMIDVDIMVDDDPRVLKSLTSAIGIAVRRPWNKEFLKFEAIHSVDSFNDVLDVINKIGESLYNPATIY